MPEVSEDSVLAHGIRAVQQGYHRREAGRINTRAQDQAAHAF